MLTKEQNELLTRVGPGTPGGELLRRYWQPVCPAAELTAERPTKRVRLLGEELVVYRLPDGRYGLVAEHCAHRGTSLAYGFVEDCGIRCAYHGWKYGLDGQCVEQPFEPAGSTYKERIRQRAYPVEKLAGLLFAYLGPEPRPLLPRWDILVRRDGTRHILVLPVLQCNWLQTMENAMDTVHPHYLHAGILAKLGISGGEYYGRPIESYGFEPFEFGFVKWRAFGGERPYREAGHPLVFPNMLRLPQGRELAWWWRVPLDDTHTIQYKLALVPTSNPEDGDAEPTLEYDEPFVGGDGDYHLTAFHSQDAMALETQGAIQPRTNEHLSASDRGIIMFRQLLTQQIERVQRGEDPMGVIRDPRRNEMIEFETVDAAETAHFAG